MVAIDFTSVLNRFRTSTEPPEAYAILLRTAIAGLSSHEKEVIDRCGQEAERLHRGQLRADGSPYIVHPQRVAVLVASYLNSDITTPVLIALTHDLIEDCGVSEDWLAERYGRTVAQGVKALSAPAVAGESKEDRRNRKTDKWQRLWSASHEVLSVHAMDVLDNAISWRFIKSEMPPSKKIPRWLWQLVNYQIPLLSGKFDDIVSELWIEVAYQRDRGFEVGSWDSP